MSLPNRRQPFEARDYIKAREYLDERVRAGDFNVTTRPTIGAHWSEIGQVDKEALAAAMREKHEDKQDEEDLGVFG
jgi:hypothetical protein